MALSSRPVSNHIALCRQHLQAIVPLLCASRAASEIKTQLLCKLKEKGQMPESLLEDEASQTVLINNIIEQQNEGIGDSLGLLVHCYICLDNIEAALSLHEELQSMQGLSLTYGRYIAENGGRIVSAIKNCIARTKLKTEQQGKFLSFMLYTLERLGDPNAQENIETFKVALEIFPIDAPGNQARLKLLISKQPHPFPIEMMRIILKAHYEKNIKLDFDLFESHFYDKGFMKGFMSRGYLPLHFLTAACELALGSLINEAVNSKIIATSQTGLKKGGSLPRPALSPDEILKSLAVIENNVVRAFLAQSWGVDLLPLEAQKIYTALVDATLSWEKCPPHLQLPLADIFCKENQKIASDGPMLTALMDVAERKNNFGKALHGKIPDDQKTAAEQRIEVEIGKILTPQREALRTFLDKLSNTVGPALIPLQMEADYTIKASLFFPCIGQGNDLIKDAVQALVRFEKWKILIDICNGYVFVNSPRFPVASLYDAIKVVDPDYKFAKSLFGPYLYSDLLKKFNLVGHVYAFFILFNHAQLLKQEVAFYGMFSSREFLTPHVIASAIEGKYFSIINDLLPESGQFEFKDRVAVLFEILSKFSEADLMERLAKINHKQVRQSLAVACKLDVHKVDVRRMYPQLKDNKGCKEYIAAYHHEELVAVVLRECPQLVPESEGKFHKAMVDKLNYLTRVIDKNTGGELAKALSQGSLEAIENEVDISRVLVAGELEGLLSSVPEDDSIKDRYLREVALLFSAPHIAYKNGRVIEELVARVVEIYCRLANWARLVDLLTSLRSLEVKNAMYVAIKAQRNVCLFVNYILIKAWLRDFLIHGEPKVVASFVEKMVQFYYHTEDFKTLMYICGKDDLQKTPFLRETYAAIKIIDQKHDFIRYLIREYNDATKVSIRAILLGYIEKDNLTHCMVMLETAEAATRTNPGALRMDRELFALFSVPRLSSAFVSAAITLNLMSFVSNDIAPSIANTFEYGAFPKPPNLSPEDLKSRLINIWQSNLRGALTTQWQCNRNEIEAEVMYRQLFDTKGPLPENFDRDYQPFLGEIALRRARDCSTALEKYTYLIRVISLAGDGVELYREHRNEPSNRLSKALHDGTFGATHTKTVQTIETKLEEEFIPEAYAELMRLINEVERSGLDKPKVEREIRERWQAPHLFDSPKSADLIVTLIECNRMDYVNQIAFRLPAVPKTFPAIVLDIKILEARLAEINHDKLREALTKSLGCSKERVEANYLYPKLLANSPLFLGRFAEARHCQLELARLVIDSARSGVKTTLARLDELTSAIAINVGDKRCIARVYRYPEGPEPIKHVLSRALHDKDGKSHRTEAVKLIENEIDLYIPLIEAELAAYLLLDRPFDSKTIAGIHARCTALVPHAIQNPALFKAIVAALCKFGDWVLLEVIADEWVRLEQASHYKKEKIQQKLIVEIRTHAQSDAFFEHLTQKAILTTDNEVRSAFVANWDLNEPHIEAEVSYALFEKNQKSDTFNIKWQMALAQTVIRKANEKHGADVLPGNLSNLPKLQFLLEAILYPIRGAYWHYESPTTPKLVRALCLNKETDGYKTTDAIRYIQSAIEPIVEQAFKELNELCQAVDSAPPSVAINAARIKELLLVPSIFKIRHKLRAGIRALFKLGATSLLTAIYDDFVLNKSVTSPVATTDLFKAMVDYDASLDFDDMHNEAHRAQVEAEAEDQRARAARIQDLIDSDMEAQPTEEDTGFFEEGVERVTDVSVYLNVPYRFIWSLLKSQRDLTCLPIRYNKHVLKQLLEQGADDNVVFRSIFGEARPSAAYIAAAIGLNKLAHLNYKTADFTQETCQALGRFVTPILEGKTKTALRYRLAQIENQALRTILAVDYGVGAKRVAAVIVYPKLISADKDERSQAFANFDRNLQVSLANEVIERAREMHDLKERLCYLTRAISVDIEGRCVYGTVNSDNPTAELAKALLLTPFGSFKQTKAAEMIMAAILETRTSLLQMFNEEVEKAFSKEAFEKEACAEQIVALVVLPGIFEDKSNVQIALQALHRMQAKGKIKKLIEAKDPLWLESTPSKVRRAFFDRLMDMREDEYDHYIVNLALMPERRNLRDLPIQSNKILLKMMLAVLPKDRTLERLPNRIFPGRITEEYIDAAFELGLLDHLQSFIIGSVFETDNMQLLKRLAEIIILASRYRRSNHLDDDKAQLAFLDKTIAMYRFDGTDYPSHDLSKVLNRQKEVKQLIEAERDGVFSALKETLDKAIVYASHSPSEETVTSFMNALEVPSVAKTVMHDTQKLQQMLRAISTLAGSSVPIFQLRTKLFHADNRHYHTPTLEFIAACIIIDNVALANSVITELQEPLRREALLGLQQEAEKYQEKLDVPPGMAILDLDQRVAGLDEAVIQKSLIKCLALPSRAIVSLALHSELALYDLPIKDNKPLLKEILEGYHADMPALVTRLFRDKVSDAYLEALFELGRFHHINWIIEQNKFARSKKLATMICEVSARKTKDPLAQYKFLSEAIVCNKKTREPSSALSRVLHKGFFGATQTNEVTQIKAKMAEILPGLQISLRWLMQKATELMPDAERHVKIKYLQDLLSMLYIPVLADELRGNLQALYTILALIRDCKDKASLTLLRSELFAHHDNVCSIEFMAALIATEDAPTLPNQIIRESWNHIIAEVGAYDKMALPGKCDRQFLADRVLSLQDPVMKREFIRVWELPPSAIVTFACTTDVEMRNLPIHKNKAALKDILRAIEPLRCNLLPGRLFTDCISREYLEAAFELNLLAHIKGFLNTAQFNLQNTLAEIILGAAEVRRRDEADKTVKEQVLFLDNIIADRDLMCHVKTPQSILAARDDLLVAFQQALDALFEEARRFTEDAAPGILQAWVKKVLELLEMPSLALSVAGNVEKLQMILQIIRRSYDQTSYARLKNAVTGVSPVPIELIAALIGENEIQKVNHLTKDRGSRMAVIHTHLAMPRGSSKRVLESRIMLLQNPVLKRELARLWRLGPVVVVDLAVHTEVLLYEIHIDKATLKLILQKLQNNLPALDALPKRLFTSCVSNEYLEAVFELNLLAHINSFIDTYMFDNRNDAEMRLATMIVAVYREKYADKADALQFEFLDQMIQVDANGRPAHELAQVLLRKKKAERFIAEAIVPIFKRLENARDAIIKRARDIDVNTPDAETTKACAEDILEMLSIRSIASTLIHDIDALEVIVGIIRLYNQDQFYEQLCFKLFAHHLGPSVAFMAVVIKREDAPMDNINKMIGRFPPEHINKMLKELKHRTFSKPVGNTTEFSKRVAKIQHLELRAAYAKAWGLNIERLAVMVLYEVLSANKRVEDKPTALLQLSLADYIVTLSERLETNDQKFNHFMVAIHCDASGMPDNELSKFLHANGTQAVKIIDNEINLIIIDSTIKAIYKLTSSRTATQAEWDHLASDIITMLKAGKGVEAAVYEGNKNLLKKILHVIFNSSNALEYHEILRSVLVSHCNNTIPFMYVYALLELGKLDLLNAAIPATAVIADLGLPFPRLPYYSSKEEWIGRVQQISNTNLKNRLLEYWQLHSVLTCSMFSTTESLRYFTSCKDNGVILTSQVEFEQKEREVKENAVTADLHEVDATPEEKGCTAAVLAVRRLADRGCIGMKPK